MYDDQIMINWEERLVWCNTCGMWIPSKHLLIDGRHDIAKLEKSAHTVWEEA